VHFADVEKEITLIGEHLQGARVFLKSSTFMIASVISHVEMAAAMTAKVEKEHTSLKRNRRMLS